ncbi:hypothetical protein U9R90_18870 [Streptomyces sp. E11-3]
MQQERGVVAVAGADGGGELLVEVQGMGDVVGDHQDGFVLVQPLADLVQGVGVGEVVAAGAQEVARWQVEVGGVQEGGGLGEGVFEEAGQDGGEGRGQDGDPSAEALPELGAGQDVAESAGVVGVQLVQDEDGVRGVDEDAGVDRSGQGRAQELVGGGDADALVEQLGGRCPGEGFGRGVGAAGGVVVVAIFRGDRGGEVVGGGAGVGDAHGVGVGRVSWQGAGPSR